MAHETLDSSPFYFPVFSEETYNNNNNFELNYKVAKNTDQRLCEQLKLL